MVVTMTARTMSRQNHSDNNATEPKSTDVLQEAIDSGEALLRQMEAQINQQIGFVNGMKHALALREEKD